MLEKVERPGVSLPKRLSMMPDRLVLVRHGESLINVINKRIKRGELSDYPEGFREIPDREFPLSAKGKHQAKAAGGWLGSHYPDGFDVVYASDHVRAFQTAAIACKEAGWPNLQIRIDPLLGERNWGRFAFEPKDRRDEVLRERKLDPLNAPMPDGETILNTKHRSRELLDRCAREFTGKRALVFSHGEFIEAIWSEIAHFATDEHKAFFESPEGDIKNTQVVEFSSTNPETGEPGGGFRWVRSSCAAVSLEGTWTTLVRKVFTPEELLSRVPSFPNLEALANG